MNYICRVHDYMAWFWFMEWLTLVYIINRIIHGCLEIWNLSSRVHIRYLTCSLRSLVQYRCEHSKINSISPRDHVLFSIYYIKTNEMLSELSRKNLISSHVNNMLFSHVKISPLLWRHNKPHLSDQKTS